MKRFWNRTGWLILAALLVLMGFLVRMTPGFAFSSYVLWGLAGVVLAYRILTWLKKKTPKLSKFLRIMLTCCLCLGLLLAAVTSVFIAKAGKGDPGTSCNYVIVLGAGVNGTVPSLILSERIGAAYDYLTENPDAICIVSGGQGPGEDITEAQAMYTALTARGIPAERLLLEERSTSTAENIAFSRELLAERGIDAAGTVAIVTNDFHQYRAQRIAADNGLKMVGVPAELPWWWLNANYYVREFFALGKLWLTSLF